MPRGALPAVKRPANDSCPSHFLRAAIDLKHEVMSIAHEKQLAAEAAAKLVEAGMIVGLGTGATVAWLLPALARRQLRLRCVASSPRTAEAARALGLQVEPFDQLERLDLVIDGADQIAPDGWLLKG